MAFLIRRCMNVRGLPRRLRNRDWVVLIHEISHHTHTDSLLKRLKNHINSQPQGQKTKITLGSNRNIYETFVGGTQSEWHHAHVDAQATAKWLASLEVTSQIPACLMPSMALIATEQVINMVEQKLHEAKLKKK